MKKITTLFVAATAAVAFSATAQTTTSSAQLVEKNSSAPKPGYVVDSTGDVVVSGTGQCVHTGTWSMSDRKVIGCDGVVAQVAPAVVAPPPAPAPAPAPVPAPEPAPTPTSEKVTFAADTFFDFDKAKLRPQGEHVLNELASRVKNVDLEVIIATGHTDAIGTDAYNQKLSQRRAQAVKDYLVSQGLPANRIYTEGKGESQPVATNKTAEGRAKNRRVEIEVVGTRTVQR